MMETLILTGSPRKNGNSEILAKTVAKQLQDNNVSVQLQRLVDLDIHPCLGCGGCEKEGNCVIDDDMQALYPCIVNADKIIIASPVYFYGLTAQTKAFVDRCQALWSRKYLLKQRIAADIQRKGYLISVAATRGKQVFTGAELCARYVFDAMDVLYDGGLFYPGVDTRGAIRKHPDFPEKLNAFVRLLLKDA